MTDTPTTDTDADTADTTEPVASPSPPSFLGRVLFGGVLAYMAIDGFKHNEGRVEAARQSGVPLPELAVPFVTGMLLVANLGIILWKFPRASAGAVAVFFLGTTPVIHDFWNMAGEERHANQVNFCKNLALLGGAIVLLDEASKRED